MRSKKIFLIILILIIALILGVLLYQFLFKKSPSFPFLTPSPFSFPEAPTFSPSPTSSPSPSLAQPTLKTIVSQPIFAFWPSATQTLQFINSQGLFEVNYQKEVKVEKKSLGVNLANVLASYPSFDKVLLKYLAVGAYQPAYALIDIKDQTLKNFEPEVKVVTWSPKGDSLIYYYSSSSFYKSNPSEKNYLAQIDSNLANKKILFELKVSSDLVISWPSTSTLYLLEKPSGYVRQTVLSFDLKNKTFKPFFEGYGVILKWGRNGDYGLLFSTEERGTNPSLQLINQQGIVLAKFPYVTLPEKCVFSRTKPYLYCAFPQSFNNLAVWPDDYYQGRFSQEEVIYRIDLRNYEAQPFFSEKFFEITQMELSFDEKELLFYDKLTNTLYALTLKED